MNTQSQTTFVAHRGLQPENTLGAFQQAYAQGFSIAECDVWVSRDHQVIVCHDETLKRTAVSSSQLLTQPIASLNCAQLQSVLVGNDHYSEPVPLLKDLLELVPAGKLLLVEIKFKDPDLMQALVETITPYLDKVIVVSFYLAMLGALKQQLPQCRAMLLTAVERYEAEIVVVHDAQSLTRALKKLKKLGLEGLGFEYSEFVTAKNIAYLPKDLLTHCWYRKTSVDIARKMIAAAVQVGIRFVNVDEGGALNDLA